MRRATCAVCHRPIWFADAYGKWMHRKPAHGYKSGPGFGGGFGWGRSVLTACEAYHFDEIELNNERPA